MESEHQRYRREMVESVSNHGGSSPLEVIYAVIPNSTSMLLTFTLMNLLGTQISSQTKIILEFGLIIVPCILCCTVYAEQTIPMFNIFLILATANILLILVWKPRDSFKSVSGSSSSRVPIVTNFRAMTNIISCVCILAVDFPCFPRRFVKTETTGFSLMDTGVGLFIISNALVSPEARNTASKATPFNFSTFKNNVVKTAKSCTPLLVLGLIRSISVELLGYQSHVTEYGKHWNFFFTLACVKLFTDVLLHSMISRYSIIVGPWIIGMHEYTLNTNGIKEWVLSDEPRDDLISANREGLTSIPGYVGLYLIGVALGRIIHSGYQKPDGQVVWPKLKINIEYTKSMILLLKFLALTGVMFVVTFYCQEYFDVSRRLANSGYCAWILFFTCFLVTNLLIIDVILDCIISCISDKARRAGKLTKESLHIVKNLEIFDAVNDNGLAFFLFSNLLTFAINMSIKTLHTDSNRAVFIIVSYMLANVTLVLLRSRGKHILSAKKNN